MSRITYQTTLTVDSITVNLVTGEIFIWAQSSEPRGTVRLQITKETLDQSPELKATVEKFMGHGGLDS